MCFWGSDKLNLKFRDVCFESQTLRDTDNFKLSCYSYTILLCYFIASLVSVLFMCMQDASYIMSVLVSFCFITGLKSLCEKLRECFCVVWAVTSVLLCCLSSCVSVSCVCVRAVVWVLMCCVCCLCCLCCVSSCVSVVVLCEQLCECCVCCVNNCVSVVVLCEQLCQCCCVVWTIVLVLYVLCEQLRECCSVPSLFGCHFLNWKIITGVSFMKFPKF